MLRALRCFKSPRHQPAGHRQRYRSFLYPADDGVRLRRGAGAARAVDPSDDRAGALLGRTARREAGRDDHLRPAAVHDRPPAAGEGAELHGHDDRQWRRRPLQRPRRHPGLQDPPAPAPPGGVAQTIAVVRVLAVDPGSKRVGLAISDPTGTIAQALATIEAAPSETLASRLGEIARDKEATRIIVGLPRRMDGSYGPEAKSARELADSLRKASGLPVELVDERLTTVAAERSFIAGRVRRAKRRVPVDRVAAAMLLQSHLDRRR